MRGAPKARDDEFTQERKKAQSNLLALACPQKTRNLSTKSDRRHQDSGADKNLRVGSGSK
jgi:hypothetical protein